MKRGFLLVYVCLGILAMSCVPPNTRYHLATTSAASQTSKTSQTSGASVLRNMKLIPGGTFQMGGRDFPARTVYVSTFYIDKYMVTNAEYKKFVDANPEFRKVQNKYYLRGWTGNNYPSGRENDPVLNVDWWAAMAYAKWVGKRLPTEAEWEKAARGGLTGQTYPWGNSKDSNKAHFGVDSFTLPVGSFPANGYGLYDMIGNGAEWCLDEYVKNPPQNTDPIAGGSIAWIISNFKNIQSSRVVRGGVESHLQALDSRGSVSPNSLAFGFRCVKEASR